MRIAVLASGSGTILEAILAAKLPVELVISDRLCRALHVGEDAGVRSVAVERTSFGSDFDRNTFTQQVVDQLLDATIELVVMAGFGTILGQPIYDHYAGRVVNTHPALLPSFKGWHGVRDALAYGVKVTGCTVHVATLAVDDGPILAQEPVRVEDDDTEESLHERIKVVERELYIKTIQSIVERGEVNGEQDHV